MRPSFIALSLFFILLLTSFHDKEKGYTLIVFEGSDWCGDCRRFEKNILNDESFVIFLEQQNITLERIDFPQRKKLQKEEQEYNKMMAEKYAFPGKYPTILLSRTDTLLYTQIHYINEPANTIIERIKTKLGEL